MKGVHAKLGFDRVIGYFLLPAMLVGCLAIPAGRSNNDKSEQAGWLFMQDRIHEQRVSLHERQVSLENRLERVYAELYEELKQENPDGSKLRKLRKTIAKLKEWISEYKKMR